MVHKSFSSCYVSGFWPASWEYSNLKDKGGKSFSIRNKRFPYGNSYSFFLSCYLRKMAGRLLSSVGG